MLGRLVPATLLLLILLRSWRLNTHSLNQASPDHDPLNTQPAIDSELHTGSGYFSGGMPFPKWSARDIKLSLTGSLNHDKSRKLPPVSQLRSDGCAAGWQCTSR